MRLRNPSRDPLILALEGPDGVGKTSVWRWLQKHLEPVSVVERRPGDEMVVHHKGGLPVPDEDPWDFRQFPYRWVFIDESLPDLEPDFDFSDPVARSWTFCHYRLRYRLPIDVAIQARAIIQDRSYLSNVIYTTDNPKLQDRIMDIEELVVLLPVTHFIILLGTHADKQDTFADVETITRRYIAWADRYPDRVTLIGTGMLPVDEVGRRVWAVIREKVDEWEKEHP